jgi:NADH-quinone oxidoreductase subunit M
MLQDRASTREMERFGGLLGRVPVFAGLMGLLVFGSLGLPGFSGFIAEFQVIGGAVSVSLWVPALTILGLIITTGLYLKIVVGVLMGEAPDGMPALADLSGRELVAVGSLTALSLLLGILPGLLISVIEPTTRMLAAIGE